MYLPLNYATKSQYGCLNFLEHLVASPISGQRTNYHIFHNYFITPPPVYTRLVGNVFGARHVDLSVALSVRPAVTQNRPLYLKYKDRTIPVPWRVRLLRLMHCSFYSLY